MTEINRRQQKIVGINSNVDFGDCAAEPVPALWHQDEDEYMVESGFVERFWLPLAVAVLAGWGSISFLLFNAFGWVVIAAVAGIAVAGLTGAVALVRTGERGNVDVVEARTSTEQAETQYRNAA